MFAGIVYPPLEEEHMGQWLPREDLSWEAVEEAIEFAIQAYAMRVNQLLSEALEGVKEDFGARVNERQRERRLLPQTGSLDEPDMI
jgi:hypothetical protein